MSLTERTSGEPSGELDARSNGSGVEVRGCSWRDLLFRHPFRGVGAFCGVPGAGKTYALASWALDEIEKGRPVYCSAGFSVPGSRVFSSIDDFIGMPNGSAVCIDEAPLWFDARAWQSLDPSVTYRLTQVRHSGIDLRYTCISPSMVEVRLRQITFDWWEYRASVGPFNKVRAMKSPDGAPKLRAEHSRWKYVLMRPSVCDAYSTHSDADVSEWRVR